MWIIRLKSFQGIVIYVSNWRRVLSIQLNGLPENEQGYRIAQSRDM